MQYKQQVLRLPIYFMINCKTRNVQKDNIQSWVISQTLVFSQLNNTSPWPWWNHMNLKPLMMMMMMMSARLILRKHLSFFLGPCFNIIVLHSRFVIWNTFFLIIVGLPLVLWEVGFQLVNIGQPHGFQEKLLSSFFQASDKEKKIIISIKCLKYPSNMTIWRNVGTLTPPYRYGKHSGI